MREKILSVQRKNFKLRVIGGKLGKISARDLMMSPRYSRSLRGSVTLFYGFTVGLTLKGCEVRLTEMAAAWRCPRSIMLCHALDALATELNSFALLEGSYDRLVHAVYAIIPREDDARLDIYFEICESIQTLLNKAYSPKTRKSQRKTPGLFYSSVNLPTL